MASPTQKKHETIANTLRNQVIVRALLQVEPQGPRKGKARKHLWIVLEGGATVLITGKFNILYEDADAQSGEDENGGN